MSKVRLLTNRDARQTFIVAVWEANIAGRFESIKSVFPEQLEIEQISTTSGEGQSSS